MSLERVTDMARTDGRAAWIVLAVSGLVTLNGVGWFFVGPTLSTFEQDTGIPLAEFLGAYPEAGRLISLQARNTALLLVGLGLMGAAIALTARTAESGPVRMGGWAFGLALAGVGLSELLAGAPFGAAYLILGAAALLGQGLTARGSSRG